MTFPHQHYTFLTATPCLLWLAVSTVGCRPSDPRSADTDRTPLQKLKAVESAIRDHRLAIESLEDTARILRAQDTVSDDAAGSLFTTPSALLQGLPRELFPIAGADRGLERKALRQWCQENLRGKRIQWTETVEEVTISDKYPLSDERPFSVTLGLYSGHPTYGDARSLQCHDHQPTKAYSEYAYGRLFPDYDSEDRWKIMNETERPIYLKGDFECYLAAPCFDGSSVRLRQCTEAMARELRDMKGDVVFTATVIDVLEVSDRSVMLDVSNVILNECLIYQHEGENHVKSRHTRPWPWSLDIFSRGRSTQE